MGGIHRADVSTGDDNRGGGLNVRVTYRGEWKRGPSNKEEDKGG